MNTTLPDPQSAVSRPTPDDIEDARDWLDRAECGDNVPDDEVSRAFDCFMALSRTDSTDEEVAQALRDLDAWVAAER